MQSFDLLDGRKAKEAIFLMKKFFDDKMNWYKGNIHTHTKQSDGAVSPERCIKIYKDKGYDFISITDHRKFYPDYREDRFLVISGSEFHVNDFEARRAYHIVGLGIENDIYTDDSFSPQAIIDEINREQGLAILAHPSWSLLTHDDLLALDGYAGIEIWNTVSDAYSGRGLSIDYLDILAVKGLIKLAFAVDDTHFYQRDLAGGYIMVNSPFLDKGSIIDAIRKGRFYCSQGPEIKQIYLDNDIITVETSPVRRICFMTGLFYCADRVRMNDDGSLISKASYKIKPDDLFVRIECEDELGRKAWSQIVKCG